MTIGSANRRLRPHVLKQLVGEDTDEAVAELDAILPSLLANDSNRSRNIYLFSSPADKQYRREILQFLPAYEQYENFNFILTDSPLLVRHNEVSTYNIPLVVATIAALGEGAVPRYGQVRNGVGAFESSVRSPQSEAVRNRQETVCWLTSLALRKGRFHPQGHLFIKGLDTAAPGQISRKLVLTSANHRESYALESVPDKSLNRIYFENEFCDYSSGRFATEQRAGIRLAALPAGRYTLSLELEHGGVSATIDSVSAEPGDESLVMAGTWFACTRRATPWNWTRVRCWPRRCPEATLN